MLNPRFFKKFTYFIIGAFLLYTVILIVPIVLSFAILLQTGMGTQNRLILWV